MLHINVRVYVYACTVIPGGIRKSLFPLVILEVVGIIRNIILYSLWYCFHSCCTHVGCETNEGLGMNVMRCFEVKGRPRFDATEI